MNTQFQGLQRQWVVYFQNHNELLSALGTLVSTFSQGKGPSCPGCFFLLLSVGVSQRNHKWRRCSRLHLVIRTKKERWIHRSKRTVWSSKGKGLSRSDTDPDKLKWSKDPQYDLKGGWVFYLVMLWNTSGAKKPNRVFKGTAPAPHRCLRGST